MSSTLNKLNEAEFFLNMLEKNKEVFPEFNFYLNAFVSSARSVLWIMRAEHSGNKDWERWFNEKPTNESEDFLLKGISDMRNRSLKKEPLKTEKFNIMSLKGASVDVLEEIKKFVGKYGENSTYDFSIESKGKTKNQLISKEKDSLTVYGDFNIYNTVKEFKDSNIVDKCIEYFVWLKSIVEECHFLFNEENLLR